MCESDPNNIGRLTGKPGTVLFKLHSTGSVKLYQGNFYLKNVHFCILFGILEEYLQSFCGNSLSRLSKLHCSWRKEFFAKKHTLWRERNSLYECFGILREKFLPEFLWVFLELLSKLKSTCPQVFLEEKTFFRTNNFFKNGFWLLVRQFCRFSEFLLWGCQNCVLRFWRNFFGKEVSFKTNIFFHKYFRNLWTFGNFSRKKYFSEEILFVQLFWTLSYNGLNTGDLFFCRFVKLSLCMSRKLFSGRLFYFTKNGFLAMFRFCRLFLDRLAKCSKFGVQL